MISVCMATYNGEKFITEQINSILSQLQMDDELIISDDSSTDNTIEIINSYKDNRIKLIENQSFKNPIFNIENAIKNALGDFIFLSDQDDIWLPDKVNKTLNYLQKYDCVVSDAIIIDKNSNILEESFYKINKTKKGFIKNFIKNGYLGCCLAFKKELIKYIIPFPRNIPMHDIWIGLISEIYGKTVFCNDALLYYRRHGSNFSMSSEKSKNNLYKKVIYRLIILLNLVKRYFEVRKV